MTDEQYEALWDSLWGYHGREPMKLSHLEFARAIESAAIAPLLERIAALEAELSKAHQINFRRHTSADAACAALEAKLAQRVPDGWRAEIVSNGDIRMYGPRPMFAGAKESWIIQSVNDGFYGFLHRFMTALLTAAPAAPEQQEPDCLKCGNNRQVWTNQISGEKTCHRVGCHTVVAKAPNAQQAAPSCESKTVDSDPQPSLSARGSQQEAAQQAEAQPVAEVIIGDDEFDLGLTDDYAFGKLKLPNGRHMLYTAQPKAVPLTEEQAKAIAGEIFPMAQLGNAAAYHARLCEVYGIVAPAEKGAQT